MGAKASNYPDDLDRARAFMRTVDERSAERTIGLGWGTAYFHDHLNGIWDLNFVGVPGPIGVPASEVFGEVERLQQEAGFRHRKLVVDDEATGKRLASDVPEGWNTTPLLIMAKRRPADREVDTSIVEEVSWDEVRPYAAAVHKENGAGKDPAGMDQLLAHNEVTHSAVPTRYFVARADGEIASKSELYSEGGVAQVEDVSTLDAFRKRGLARAVVHHVTEIASREGHELVFLVADADDWPRELYAKLGYDPIGIGYEFMRKPPGL
jgi:GNAT superfamily N-acetyltransferase